MRAAVIFLLALTAGEGATEALRARAEQIRETLPPSGSPMTPQQRQKIEDVITRTIDLRGMVQSAMGARWKEITEKQRKRLIAAFENRFRQASSGDFDPYRSTQIEYRSEVVEADGLVQVPTKVVVKGEPTEITYTMRHEKDGWRIVDITIDGVSTVANYRASFARVSAKDGVEGLIRKLEKGGTGAKS